MKKTQSRASQPLSVTVGKQFESGFKRQEDESATSSEAVRLRIKELTETAQILLNRGLSESAFETLMRAYLLDPLNPDVLLCEKRVLPAWEALQKNRGALNPPTAPFTPSSVEIDADARRGGLLRKRR